MLSVIVLLLAGGAVGLWHSTEETKTDALTRTVLDAPPEGLPYALENLRPLRRRAIPRLDRVLGEPASTPKQKYNAALALADFGSVRVDALVDGVVLGTPRLDSLTVAALRSTRSESLAAIGKRFAETTELGERVRLATAALHLGDAAFAREMLAATEDPPPRTAFIIGFSRWHEDVPSLAAFLDDAHGMFRSGLLAAMALVPWSDLEPQGREALGEAIAELYTGAPDGATHSAAFCVLTNWQRPLPEVEPIEGLPAERDWFVNEQGMTMIRIPAGTFVRGDNRSCDDDERPALEVKFTRDFFLSDREVTRELIERFVDETSNDADYPARERVRDWRIMDWASPEPDCPVNNFSWFDAVRFCNWLSRREGLPVCYRLVSGEGEEEVWEVDLWCGGYRLPTEAEWEYACRAGTTTQYFTGDNDEGLDAFAWWVTNARERSWPAGLKLPNAWGLFDMHGNVWEWCHDWYDAEYYGRSPLEDPPCPSGGSYRVLRGGGWSSTARGCRSACRGWFMPEYRHDYLGFRVARSPSGK